jgi:hypothetical protein
MERNYGHAGALDSGSRIDTMRVLLLLAFVLACRSAPQNRSSGARAEVLGFFIDDYNATHSLSPTEWRHGTRAKYHITKWNSRDQYFIARNDSLNPGDGGLWSRVDWMRLDGMAPWTWAFCMSAFKAPTADSAESTRVANRSTPRTGCNGFPFTRMRSRP